MDLLYKTILSRTAVSGILQQQQLAYAALAAMLRKDMPNMSDQQIRDMLPHIYNANPGVSTSALEAQPGFART